MKKFACLVIVLLNVQIVFAQGSSDASIRRIADYGKLWCVLDLFHPAMAYHTINADSLFTDNIEGLIKNPTAESFRKAIHEMINRINDSHTSIEDEGEIKGDSVSLPARQLLRWVGDSVALLYFDPVFITGYAATHDNKPLLSLIDSIKNAHGIIIDLRKNSANAEDYPEYYESEFMTQLVGHLIDRNVVLPSYRSRIHYGHESETFDMSSYYYQGWVLINGPVVKKLSPVLHKPICLVINRFDKSMADAILSMQKENIAKVVSDGNPGNFESPGYYEMKLADSIKVRVRTTEALYPDGSKTFLPDTIMETGSSSIEHDIANTALAMLRPDRQLTKTPSQPMQNLFHSDQVSGYDSLVYPPASLRLLGLVRYWSSINYFCPNKDRITKNWDSVLYEYVPKFLQAKDSLDYVLIVARLIKEINDTHGFFSNPIFDRLIQNVPPVQITYAQKKTIINKIFSDLLKKNLSVGDEILAVDGIPIKKFRDSVAQYIGASNDASLQRDVSMRVLAGRKDSEVKIKILHKGVPSVTTLRRSDNIYQIAYRPPEGPVFKKLSDKIGYVDLGSLNVTQVDSMFTTFMNTEAIIIDDRSYPRGTVWSIASHLSQKTVIGAKGSTVIADSPEPLSQTIQESLWEIPVTPKPQYKGRIIVLANEMTLSQAEYSCMVLQAASPKVTIIGSQTSGADGDVTGIKFPGGIQTSFSGHGVHYPDGRPTQGIGIIPGIKITPTINGIRAGKDEVLERAIQFAKTGK